MNEAPDEPAGLSSQKNGSAIPPKSYPPHRCLAPPTTSSNSGGNFRIGERDADNKRLRHFPRRLGRGY